MVFAIRAMAGVLALGTASATSATTVVFTDQAAFQSQLTSAFTLVNLDGAPLKAFASGYRLDDASPAAALLAMGIDSVGLNARVDAGQNFQTATDRDRLIINGQTVGGHIAFNFTNPVNGVGAYSNTVDYGRVRLFSESNLGGVFLGEAQFGPGGFGGIISDVQARSAQFTCDFNQDLVCGVYDIQFGTGNLAGAVPEPATWAMMILGFGFIGAAARRAPQSKVSHA